ncbi:MAG: isoprenylcysteine carboxylmethyltransferase family protein [Planctomycetes bacterium]|nr:isoprenylcysteine carboxylmethyltransferase family protein [Planctomycetota bacterium]
MQRKLFFTYGLACYGLFFGTYLYMAGFFGNFLVPRSIDGPVHAPLGEALAVNLVLMLAFGLQHSVMARPWFKKWWTRYIPEPIERSTYVLASCIALALLMWQWQPMGGVIWDIRSPVPRGIMYALFAFGWLAVPLVSLLINHFDLFGMRQVWLHNRGQQYTHLPFRTPLVYKHIRHPLYVGWAIAFWATPTMTVAHLVMAIGLTGYMLIAIPFEERDLIRFHGDNYTAYRTQVPALIPRLRSRL